jgi:hypothetical protein
MPITVKINYAQVAQSKSVDSEGLLCYIKLKFLAIFMNFGGLKGAYRDYWLRKYG